MKREDIRDEALGTLLRGAAREASRSRGAPDPFAVGLNPGDDKVNARTQPAPRRPLRWTRWAPVAAAAVLAAALGLPALYRHRAVRAEVYAAAEALSRSLVREAYPLLAEIPARSEVEAAAADFAFSLLTEHRDL